MANFDRIAPLYRALEYGSFGPLLARCRAAWLPELGGSRRALVLGDGDGRFLARLLRQAPAVYVDSVDGSPAMLRRQLRRAQRAGAQARVRLHRADARTFPPPGDAYDLVATHFFFDCLTEAELEALVARVVPRLAPNARWLVSEFAIADHGWRRLPMRLVVGGLYLAFRWITGLQVRRLPDYAAALQRHGLRRIACRPFLGGLLRAELWDRVPARQAS
ncbi:MAG TPA: class I SAM-dependent methyltransferase [Terriglobales bacterium]|nr:class I SAM-dependent methyltransferase [Terriglobales bacterium]